MAAMPHPALADEIFNPHETQHATRLLALVSGVNTDFVGAPATDSHYSHALCKQLLNDRRYLPLIATFFTAYSDG
ncbi:hypothetical protein Mal33_53540 [Rosistilla oblonga]|uniref:Uncharacterized protein n=1 Tax=Rosistilla oblonga TaxID=2527990 RepID=A0A518J1W4_9BACT|nr:hypothetical protein Mal33_53540 [Rosistilla oblonga]